MSSKTVLKRAPLPVILSAAAIAFAQVNVAAAQTYSTSYYGSTSTALTIYGQPATTAYVGQVYAFTPKVSRYSRYLKFSVANKPSWLYFVSYGGTLYGVPRSANVGTYSNIVISVTDGRTTA